MKYKFTILNKKILNLYNEKYNTIFKKKIASTKTPLRISFSGGGTDMPYFYKKYSGLTVSTSIDKFVYVTIKSHPHFKKNLD